MHGDNQHGEMGSLAYGGIKLFAGNSHPQLAEEIAGYLGLKLSGRDSLKFPNENIFWRLHESVRGQDVFLIQTLSSPVSDNIMELLIAIDCLRRDSAARITVVMPYMAYARSDKKDQPRVPITARLMADMIVTAGADRYITVDLHAGQIQGFFSIPGDEITGFHILSDYFVDKKLRDAVIVTADLGFAKRGRNFAAKLHRPMAFVEKRRVGNTAQSEALTVIGDVDGCDVIIVDDEISTGGSISNTVKAVKKYGAREVYITVTHAVLVGPAIERLRELPIKEIVTTNTLPATPERTLPNMKILSVGPLLGEVISRVHLGRSVGEMFNE
ncbi:MAG: ribose-phosphate diphosphokinase [Chloroflexi bacterium]|nr:ribose-phosphate diphosphokinase [Chloroflexota bacterium]MCL5274820.1 ribose-phosphate diphosphokinase [Chloroflexota bacterium]